MSNSKVKKFIEKFGVWETLIMMSFFLIVLTLSSLMGIFYGMTLGVAGIILWKLWMKNKITKEGNL